jgi:hypothetical protein
MRLDNIAVGRHVFLRPMGIIVAPQLLREKPDDRGWR